MKKKTSKIITAIAGSVLTIVGTACASQLVYKKYENYQLRGKKTQEQILKDAAFDEEFRGHVKENTKQR